MNGAEKGRGAGPGQSPTLKGERQRERVAERGAATVRRGRVLQEDREHHGAHGSAELLHDPARTRGGCELLGREAPVGRGHRGDEDGTDAEAHREQRDREERWVGPFGGQREGEGAGDGQGHTGQCEGAFGTRPIDELADEEERQTRADGARREEQSGLEHGVPAGLLVVERDQERHAEEGDPEQEHQPRRRGKGPHPEQAEVEDRRGRGAQSVHDVRAQQGHAQQAGEGCEVGDPVQQRAESDHSSANPSTSSGATSPLGGSAGTVRQASTRPRRQIGTLMKNAQRQLRLPMTRPPRTGPRIGARLPGVTTNAIARPSRSLPADSARIVRINGSSIPPPSPWRTRNAMRLPMDHAAPESTEPSRNSARQLSHIRRAPKRWTDQAVSGTTMISASR